MDEKYFICKKDSEENGNRINNYLEKGITLVNIYKDENNIQCYRFLKSDLDTKIPLRTLDNKTIEVVGREIIENRYNPIKFP